MTDGTVNLGIVGAGYWARSAHLPSLRDHAGARVRAIASRGGQSAREVAADFDIPNVADSWQDLLARDDVEAVIVTTPANTHHAIVMAALERGKHVLCEGTLCMTAAEALQMCEAAEKAGVVHAYIRPRPFLYGGEEVRQLIADGAIGTPEIALLTWRGNPWLRALPSQTWRVRADAAPPVVVGVPMAIALDLFGPMAGIAGRVQRLYRPPGADDTALAPDEFHGTLLSESGVGITLEAGWSEQEPPFHGLRLTGSEGTLRWNWAVPARIEVRGADGGSFQPVEFTPEADLGRAWPFARGFVDAILAGRGTRPNFRDGLRELEAIEAVLRSSNTSMGKGF